MAIKAGQQILAKDVLGLSAYPEGNSFLTLTNAYQDLVTAPVSGIKRVNHIYLENEDSTVTTDFYFKVVRSGTDYLPFVFSLAPGERLLFSFPYLLDTNTKIQAKLAATASAYASAPWTTWYGGMGVNNITGVSWASLINTTAVGSAVSLYGTAVMNTHTLTQVIGVRVVDDTLTSRFAVYKSVTPGGIWVLDLKMYLAQDWRLQFQGGVAGYAVSGVASYVTA